MESPSLCSRQLIRTWIYQLVKEAHLSIDDTLKHASKQELRV